MSELVVATCSYPGTYDLKESMERHHGYINEAANAGARLVLFPEISLHGYPPLFDFTGRGGVAGSLNPTAAEVFDQAEPVPDGPMVKELAEHAADRDIYVAYGLHERGGQPGVIYNSVVLTGPQGHVGCYRKVHVHALESVVWRPGADFPVFETEIGRIGIMICYDKWWPESARELMLRGAEVFLAPAGWGGPMEEEPQDFANWSFRLYDQVRALENSRWLISSNFTGRIGVYDCGGHSSLIDPMGRVVATTGPRAGLAIASVDLHAGIRDAAASMRGARLIRDRRPDAYRVLGGEIPPAVDG